LSNRNINKSIDSTSTTARQSIPYINNACSEEVFYKIAIKSLVLQFELVTSSNRLTIVK